MRQIGVTSEKGGVGKSTLAWHLSGALAGGKSGGKARRRVVLVDEDSRVGSCLEWARAAQGRGEHLPFTVTAPEGAQAALEGGADFLVVDSEGRPPLADLVEMARSLDLVLLPTGTTRPEIVSTIRLWGELQDAGAADRVRVVVTRAAPVGRAGLEARDALRGAGLSVMDTVVRRLAAYERAAEVGGLVRDVTDPRAAEAWNDIQRLALEVTQ